MQIYSFIADIGKESALLLQHRSAYAIRNVDIALMMPLKQ